MLDSALRAHTIRWSENGLVSFVLRDFGGSSFSPGLCNLHTAKLKVAYYSLWGHQMLSMMRSLVLIVREQTSNAK